MILFLSGQNKLKFIDGQLFTSQKGLRKVSLIGNECVDQIFIGESEIASISGIVTTQCGLDENVETITMNVEELSTKSENKNCEDLMNQISTMRSFMAEKKQACRLRETTLENELVASRLVAEKAIAKLEFAENATFEAQSQIMLIKQSYDGLNNTLQIKLREIEEMRNNL